MNLSKCALLATLLYTASVCATANDAAANCFSGDVDAHVLEQFAIFGPRSIDHEYFGFIYRYDDAIGSAVTRGLRCTSGNCVVNIRSAARLIPAGGRILGEWHTHPHNGAVQLSEYDVHGAHLNRYLKCYLAYYSNPEGRIFAWDPGQTSVPTAMATRVQLGSYSDAASVLARHDANPRGGRRTFNDRRS